MIGVPDRGEGATLDELVHPEDLLHGGYERQRDAHLLPALEEFACGAGGDPFGDQGLHPVGVPQATGAGLVGPLVLEVFDADQSAEGVPLAGRERRDTQPAVPAGEDAEGIGRREAVDAHPGPAADPTAVTRDGADVDETDVRFEDARVEVRRAGRVARRAGGQLSEGADVRGQSADDLRVVARRGARSVVGLAYTAHHSDQGLHDVV